MSEATSGDQLTLWPAAYRASLSAWPGSKQAQQMTVTSGRKLLESSRLCGRVGSALKMYLASSAWRSTMCLLTWKPKATPRGRLYYQLAVSVPRIDGSEFGWWPTPTVDDANNVTRESGQFQSLTRAVMFPTPNAMEASSDLNFTVSGDGRQKPNKLGWAVAAMLPTPDAGMVQGGRTLPEGTSPTGMTPDGKKRQVGLTNAVKMLPTPRASDCHHEGIDAGIRHKEKWGSQTLATTARVSSQSTAKLNPAWVSRMMGFPDGWMDVGEVTP